jgi:hypothetical protein
MPDNPNLNRNITPRSGGFFQDLTDRFRLISRLMMDSRVNPFIKALPVGALAYAIWPFDFPTPIDDVFVIWLGTTLFVQLCPPEVVDEHTRALAQRASTVEWKDYQQGDVIDGEYYDAEARNHRR